MTGEAEREFTANPIKAMTRANSIARTETDHLQHTVQLRRLLNPEWVDSPIGLCMIASFEGRQLTSPNPHGGYVNQATESRGPSET